MGVKRQTGGKKQMDIHYVRAPAPYSVEENFEVIFPDHDGLTLAQLLQDQEAAYQSLQINVQTNATRPSNATPRGGPNDGQSHGNFFQTVNVESQLAMDEVYARELQELENQHAYPSLNGTSGVGTGSSTSSSQGNSSHNASTQVIGDYLLDSLSITREDDVDPNYMTYEEAAYQSLERNIQTNDGQSHGNSSQTMNAESQLAMDEVYARELQELENQHVFSSLNGTSGVGIEPSTSSSQGNSSNNASTQITIEDDVDLDNMTYQELQSLGEAIGTKSRGLSDELVSYLPVSTYKTGLFHRKKNHEECVICYMTYKNREKMITLPCQHSYHKGCITKWLKINKACPICNEEVFGS